MSLTQDARGCRVARLCGTTTPRRFARQMCTAPRPPKAAAMATSTHSAWHAHLEDLASARRAVGAVRVLQRLRGRRSVPVARAERARRARRVRRRARRRRVSFLAAKARCHEASDDGRPHSPIVGRQPADSAVQLQQSECLTRRRQCGTVRKRTHTSMSHFSTIRSTRSPALATIRQRSCRARQSDRPSRGVARRRAEAHS